MKTINEIHLKIAKELIKCAQSNSVISYTELCERIGSGSPRRMGPKLEQVSLLTYEMTGKIFLSVLVVLKETKTSSNPHPGSGFLPMYDRVCKRNNMSDEEVIRAQRQLAYEQDWSGLIPFMEQHMNL